MEDFFDPFYILLRRKLSLDQEEKLLKCLNRLYEIGNFSMGLYGVENLFLNRVMENALLVESVEIGYQNISESNLKKYEWFIDTYFESD